MVKLPDIVVHVADNKRTIESLLIGGKELPMECCTGVTIRYMPQCVPTMTVTYLVGKHELMVDGKPHHAPQITIDDGRNDVVLTKII